MNTSLWDDTIKREPHDWTWFEEILKLVGIIEEDEIGCVYECPCHRGQRHHHKWTDEQREHRRRHHHHHPKPNTPRAPLSAHLNIYKYSKPLRSLFPMPTLQFTAPVSDANRTGFKVRIFTAGDHSTASSTIDANPSLDANGAGEVDLSAQLDALAPGASVDVSISAVGPAGESSQVFADNDPFSQPFGTPSAPLSAHLA